MATYNWSIPTGNIITGSTYIKDTDNKIQDTMDDLADFVNSSGSYTGQGLMFDYVDKANNQTITGVKTFSNGLIGNVTGNVTGTVSGNSGTATKLATARTITLAGDVTGSVSFDGSANASITTTVGDDSHSHSIAYIAGLQTALDGKLSTSGNAASATNATNATNASYATTQAYGTNDTTIATTAFVRANSDEVNATTVGSAIANIGVGAVGSFAFLSKLSNGGSIAVGEIVSGASLAYAGINIGTSTGNWADSGTQGASPSGTWKSLGYCASFTAGWYPSTLFMRVS